MPFIRSLCIVTFFLAVAAAQTDTSSLSGAITDPTGGGVPNAAVTLKSKSTGAARSASAGPDGRYQLNLLSPGLYEITIEAQGFKTFSGENVQLRVAQEAALNVKLELGTTTQTVQVDSSVSMLNMESAAQGTVIGQEI